jgi:hypothetical protein
MLFPSFCFSSSSFTLIGCFTALCCRRLFSFVLLRFVFSWLNSRTLRYDCTFWHNELRSCLLSRYAEYLTLPKLRFCTFLNVPISLRRREELD